MKTVSRFCTTVMLMAVLAGCGGGSRQQPATGPSVDVAGPAPESEVEFQAAPDRQDTPGGNPPAFPGSCGDIFSPVHMVSEEGFQTPGDGFVDSFGANNRAGANAGEYVLIPEEGDIAWAMYSIPDLTGDRPVRVEFAVTPAELESGSGEDLHLSYWIGVADYTLYHWDWRGPFSDPQELVINSDKLKDRYVSEVGTLHWVAVLYGDEEDGLPGMTLQNGTVVTDADYIANKPHYTAIDTIEVGSGGSGGGKGASELDLSQYITITWQHIPAFSPDDTQNEAYIYQVFRRGPMDPQPVNIGSLLAPDVTYVDPADNPSTGNEPMPGAVYRYYLRAVNQNGFTPLSLPETLTIMMLVPEDLQASDGTYTDQISLSWTGMEETATGYHIYRDSQGTEFATVGNVTTWDDSTLMEGDYLPHTYWVAAINEYGESGFSNSDTGHQNAPPVADLQADPTSGDAPLLVGFDASGSLDPDGTIQDYEWDFDGDGTFNESDNGEDLAQGNATAEYTYADGTFNPEVRVTDSLLETSNASVFITVSNSAPVADLVAVPTSGDSPLLVSFDASGSTDADGTVEQYEWDLDGDGVFNEAGAEADAQDLDSAEYTYDNGIYGPVVRVTDNIGATDTATVQIIADNQPPQADLTIGGGQESGEPPHMVDFDANGSSDPDGTVVQFDWDWEGDEVYEVIDGSSTPSHEYTDSGVYQATVRVHDNDGITDTASVTINVNLPPSADLSADPLSGTPPLIVDFNASGSSDPDGTVGQYDWDWDGDGTYDQLDGGATPNHTYNDAGTYNATVRVTDDDGAQDTDFVTVDLNTAPTADLQAAPRFGTISLTVNFDATGSFDTDGTIDQYDYDWDTDGTYDLIDGGATPSHNYTSSGIYTATVRVTDNGGVTDSADISVYVVQWQIHTIDSTDDTGRFTSLTVVDGLPAITYQDVTGEDLNFARATTATPSSSADWQTHAIDGTLGWDTWTSLNVVGGKPAVSYFRKTGEDLYYAQASSTTPSGSGNWSLHAVHTPGDNGRASSLKIHDGKPAISYWYKSIEGLNYARATVAEPSSSGHWSIHTIETNIGQANVPTSLAIVGGKPAIAYIKRGDRDLKFARATVAEPTASGHWSAHVIDTSVDIDIFVSLVELGGRPAIAYFNDQVDDLKYALASSATPNSGSDWTSYAIDSANAVGQWPSQVVLDSRPAISYYVGAPIHELRIAWASNISPANSADWDIVMVDTAGQVGQYSSLAILNGNLAVSYYDVSNGDLKFARPE